MLFLLIFGSACNSKVEQHQDDNSNEIVTDSLVDEVVKDAEKDEPFEFIRNKNKHPQNYFINPFDVSFRLLVYQICFAKSIISPLVYSFSSTGCMIIPYSFVINLKKDM